MQLEVTKHKRKCFRCGCEIPKDTSIIVEYYINDFGNHKRKSLCREHSISTILNEIDTLEKLISVYKNYIKILR